MSNQERKKIEYTAELTGEWEKVQKYFDTIGDKIKENVQKATGVSAELIDKTVTGHLDSQDLKSKWKPLSKAYVKRKKKLGLSSNFFTYSGTYRQNIGIELSSDRLSGFVGVKRGVKSKNKGELVDLAYILEYGSEKDVEGEETKKVIIPARPLWRPSLKETKKEIYKIYKTAIKEAIKK